MDGGPSSRDRAEARGIKIRARLVDAVKVKVSRLEKEMTEISELMQKVFADDATDQVKNYTEEVCRLLIHETGETRVQTKKAKGKNAETKYDEAWKQAKYAEMRDTKPCSSIASSTEACTEAIPTKHLQRNNANASRSTASSRQTGNRVKETRKLTELERCRETIDNGCTTSGQC